MNLKQHLYLATIDPNSASLARKFDLGLEICQFCTAMNMDDKNFSVWDQQVKEQLTQTSRAIFHGPFNELHPSAIDPLALALAKYRFKQAAQLAATYGIHKLVLHSGYVPHMYMDIWFIDRSIEFWQEFIRTQPDHFSLYIENIQESNPDVLREIIQGINDTRVKLCLDIGHAHVFSKLSPAEWVNRLGAAIGHVHLHNNDGINDHHWPLNQGTIDIKEFLTCLSEKSPNATITLENSVCEDSIQWLTQQHYL
ncbi:MAG: TIM barrel protein [Clostridiales bacterium]